MANLIRFNYLAFHKIKFYVFDGFSVNYNKIRSQINEGKFWKE
jgi:hypothetical protein